MMQRVHDAESVQEKNAAVPVVLPLLRRLKEWLRRPHGVATKNLPNYLGWRRTLEAMGQTASSAAMILGAIGLGPYQQKTL